jgi:hypothetical protein
MTQSSPNFVGVDPTAGRHPFTFAALDFDRRLIALKAGDIEDVLSFVSEIQAVTVAVNAPPRPNHGLVRRKLEMLKVPAGQLRGSDLRLAESELRERGILVQPTPSRPGICPTWMQSGFDLYSRLAGIGFQPFSADRAPLQFLETHPHAAYCALLGRLPLPKPTLEGRLQRQAALYEQGVVLKDPMGFFEEVTRHKLLLGLLPEGLIYAPEELDALMAASVAYLAGRSPQELTLVGDQEEGQIALPVASLKERYS